MRGLPGGAGCLYFTNLAGDVNGHFGFSVVSWGRKGGEDRGLGAGGTKRRQGPGEGRKRSTQRREGWGRLDWRLDGGSGGSRLRPSTTRPDRHGPRQGSHPASGRATTAQTLATAIAGFLVGSVGPGQFWRVLRRANVGFPMPHASPVETRGRENWKWCQSVTRFGDYLF